MSILPKFRSILILLTASVGSLNAHAARLVSATEPPAAITPELVQKLPATPNLEYLKLTPEQVRERDRKLAPIYEYYREATVSKVLRHLEQTFGSNIYHYQDASHGLYLPNLADKKGTMDSIIRYYTGYGIERSPFAHASSAAVPLRETVDLLPQRLHFLKLEGESEGSGGGWDCDTPFLIHTFKYQSSNRDWFGNNWYKYSLYSTTQNHLFDAPVLDHFLNAMKESNLKALDATVVFTTSDVTVSSTPATIRRQTDWRGYRQPDPEAKTGRTQVVYPAFSNTAPIPQPVVFISREAGTEDIVKMLNEHAPRIYAYNQLFNARLLPQAEEVSRLLKKYPQLLDEVKRAAGTVSEENARAVVMKAFFNTNYLLLSAGAAVLSLPVILASPILYPVFISQITMVTVVVP